MLGALLLGVIAFLSFGGTNVFTKPTRFLIYFNESVSGMDPGAAVKISGVRIGRVAAVNVRYDQGSKEALVQTTCEIDRNILTDISGKQIDLTVRSQLQGLIDRGLRARLSLTGITGLLFVELKFEDPKIYPVNARFIAEQYPVVPAIPSPISEVQQSIVEIVADIKKVDFTGISKQIQALLASTTQKVNDLDMKGLGTKVGRAADAVTEFINSPDAKQSFANLNGAIADIRATLARIDSGIGPVGEELKKTLTTAQSALKTLDATASTTRQFVQSQGNVGDELTQSLRQLADAAAALERLADTIDRNPSSLIVGKKKTGTP